MKLKNINIEERMKHYNLQGLSITLLEGGEISGTKRTPHWVFSASKKNRKTFTILRTLAFLIKTFPSIE
ncbi:hypothetical protein [Peribacillus butanolivorans]|uniref:hypothetical protein n=1 Tax=Peribacillus butanolivorans TaxID=421767 RepID=UPI0036DEF559